MSYWTLALIIYVASFLISFGWYLWEGFIPLIKADRRRKLLKISYRALTYGGTVASLLGSLIPAINTIVALIYLFGMLDGIKDCIRRTLSKPLIGPNSEE
jgi:hypothetical protein